ncbi:hypothetical protein [uncultured Stenotrophomonas sp.]|uniref:hypothetical protein n=1 Tax=uncultured Stenotrophomonas sp. TaxID=165438 RepID=UPI0025DEFFDF|nr:hypothetical protein [uncultured Stenotrophomonas sp.]
MYGWVRRFMSYRSFYLWRARYRYYTRHLDAWTLTTLLCLSGMVVVLWYYWQFTNVPPPRVHPQAAALRLESVSHEAINRIVLVRHGGNPSGQEFTTAAGIRANAQRTMRVRQTLESEMVWRLKAHMLADIADYIDATDGCAPYQCTQVVDRITSLREAAMENAATNRALQRILDGPDDLVPCLESSNRQRLKTGWSDPFNDVYYQTWLLNDLHTMHARMMTEYPKRAPLPWLAAWLSDPEPPRDAGMPL